MTTKVSAGVFLLGLIAFSGGLVAAIASKSDVSSTADPAHASALVYWLNLDAEQAEAIQKLDPDFHTEITTIQEELNAARNLLAALFEDTASTDEQIRQQTELVIQAHNKRERRIAEHIIAVRGELTAEQQQKLFSMCAKGVRRCCESTGEGWGCSNCPMKGTPKCAKNSTKRCTKDCSKNCPKKAAAEKTTEPTGESAGSN